jgi:cyclic beta-1,2-glucan synthetase
LSSWSTLRSWPWGTSTRVHFAILGDFADAATAELPADDEILDAARAGVDDLNARLGRGRTDRFHLFHRVRQWNPGEGSWIGWERKRGKLEEFNRLLRGATDTSFHLHVGDPRMLPSIRYCITLDSDTGFVARGPEAHRHHRPSVEPSLLRSSPAPRHRGYGILQPRVSVTMASAAGSLFARVYAGHTGVDPYTTAVSDTYQDLFKEGPSRARACMTSTPSWPRSRAGSPRTPSCPTTSSRACTPGPPW